MNIRWKNRESHGMRKKKENKEKPRKHGQRKEQPKRKHMKRGIERASSSH